jgi:hypothetical protein
MSAGERSRQRSQCFLVALICDVGEVAGNFKSHALGRCRGRWMASGASAVGRGGKAVTAL